MFIDICCQNEEGLVVVVDLYSHFVDISKKKICIVFQLKANGFEPFEVFFLKRSFLRKFAIVHHFSDLQCVKKFFRNINLNEPAVQLELYKNDNLFGKLDPKAMSRCSHNAREQTTFVFVTSVA